MKRDDLLKSQLRSRFNPGCRWLDVGAGTGLVSQELEALLKPESYVCVDVVASSRPGQPVVHQFNGTGADLAQHAVNPKNQPFPYDFVLFNFVLHHAGDAAPCLLRHAGPLAKTLVIQEDIPNDDPMVQEALRLHDPKAIYRGMNEWEELFTDVYGDNLRLIEAIQFPENELIEDVMRHQVPRALFILTLNRD